MRGQRRHLVPCHAAERPGKNVGKDQVIGRAAAHRRVRIALREHGPDPNRRQMVDPCVLCRGGHGEDIIVGGDKHGPGPCLEKSETKDRRPASHIKRTPAKPPVTAQDRLGSAKAAFGRRVRARPERLRRLDQKRPACRRRRRLDVTAVYPEPADAARWKGGAVLGKPVALR